MSLLREGPSLQVIEDTGEVGEPWLSLKTSSYTVAVGFKQTPKELSSCGLLAVLDFNRE